MKYIFILFIFLIIAAFASSLRLDVMENIRQDNEILSRSLEDSFEESYLLKCELADKNRIPKWQPPRYKFMVQKEKVKRGAIPDRRKTIED